MIRTHPAVGEAQSAMAVRPVGGPAVEDFRLP
jgi:hypothetical protein